MKEDNIFWSNGRLQEKEETEDDHILMFEWSRANKINKSMRTIIFGRTFMHIKKNK